MSKPNPIGRAIDYTVIDLTKPQGDMVAVESYQTVKTKPNLNALENLHQIGVSSPSPPAPPAPPAS